MLGVRSPSTTCNITTTSIHTHITHTTHITRTPYPPTSYPPLTLQEDASVLEEHARATAALSGVLLGSSRERHYVARGNKGGDVSGMGGGEVDGGGSGDGGSDNDSKSSGGDSYGDRARYWRRRLVRELARCDHYHYYCHIPLLNPYHNCHHRQQHYHLFHCYCHRIPPQPCARFGMLCTRAAWNAMLASQLSPLHTRTRRQTYTHRQTETHTNTHTHTHTHSRTDRTRQSHTQTHINTDNDRHTHVRMSTHCQR